MPDCGDCRHRGRPLDTDPCDSCRPVVSGATRSLWEPVEPPAQGPEGCGDGVPLTGSGSPAFVSSGGGGSAGYVGFPDARPEPDKTCENCQHRLDPARAACEFCCALQNWQPRIVAPLGVKLDDEKTRWDLVPWPALELVAQALTLGAAKYPEPENWRRVPNARRRYFAAAIRHAVAWLRGERLDPESKLPHLAHLACNALFLLSFDLDDAPPPALEEP